MLTSPRTNGADHFVPSHHLALITQPVLGARSRSRKKTNNISLETSAKDTIDSMTNSRRSSFNDSPPLILPINRIDTLQYQKKSNSNSHHESSDSGLDLSLSTNSSVQLQQYPQQHLLIHRPLSALNEDSNPDEHQSTINTVRLRFPPVTFGRNRSMEDIISNNNNNTNDQQHRSSSFSDERQQKFSLQNEQKMKRSSDGTILDLIDTSTEPYRRTNELIYPSSTQQHRSLNDLANKNSNKVLSIRNESNINNLPITQTIIRKPNTSTLKPLRKKTKLNIIIEPSIPLTSSRLNIYDEQINQMTGTTSSSSNQTTPRSIRPLIQQQIKPKSTTPLDHYSNQEQIRAQVNRSVVERQQHSLPLPPTQRRRLIQQMIPFDASPAKVNNLLLRHPHQPTALFHPSSNSQLSPSRQIKQVLPTLYDEETISNVHEEKNHFKQKDESNQIHQKRQGKIKEPISSKINYKRQNSQDQLDQTNPQRHFINSIQRQQDRELTLENNQKINRLNEDNENIYTNTPRRQYEHHLNGENRQRRTIINDSNRNLTNERYGSSQSSSTTGKPLDGNYANRKQQRNTNYVTDPTVHINRSDGSDEKQRVHGSKPAGINLRTKTNDKNFTRRNESNNQYGPDYSHNAQKNALANLQSRPAKTHFQTNETSTTTRNSTIQPQSNPNRPSNQYQTSKYGNDHYPWHKSQTGSTSKPTRIQPILSINTNNSNPQREREASRLSNISKTDSLQPNEKHFKQKIIDKSSIASFQTKSPTSWSIISEHETNRQQLESHEKTSQDQSEISTSPSSQDELINENSNTPSRTYRLIVNDQQQQPLDGRYVIPSNNLLISTSHASSRQTHSFICTPDFEINDDTIIDNSSKSIQNKKQKSIVPDVYVLTDRDSTQDTIDRQYSPSPLVHLSSNKKFYSPSPTKATISKEKDEIASNYDSDDGWSDDSAELLYVDERYATEMRKITPSSHLPNHHYQIQQQNVLLQ